MFVAPNSDFEQYLHILEAGTFNLSFSMMRVAFGTFWDLQTSYFNGICKTRAVQSGVQPLGLITPHLPSRLQYLGLPISHVLFPQMSFPMVCATC